MKKFVFFFAWKEALFCFQQMTVAAGIGLRSRDNRDNAWNLFTTTMTMLEAWNVASSLLMEFVVKMQVRDPCTLIVN